jgi:hypothetical protein
VPAQVVKWSRKNWFVAKYLSALPLPGRSEDAVVARTAVRGRGHAAPSSVPSREDDRQIATTALAQLSYEAAVRSLDLQERAVEQLRARTATLLAVAALTASFFGVQTIQRTDGLGTMAALALVATACSIGLCIYVLLPERDYAFGMTGPEMYETTFMVADDDDEVRRRLVYWLHEFWSGNEQRIARLDRYYVVAAAVVMAQLVLWTVALTATIS